MVVGDSHFRHEVGQEYGVSVRRENFDGYLVEKAMKAGAEVQDGCKVTQVKEQGGVEVATDGGRFESRFLVIAEGVSSLTADRLLGPRPPGSLAVGSAVECDVEGESGDAIGLHLIESPLGRPRFRHYFPTNGGVFPLRHSLLLSVVTKDKGPGVIRSAFDRMETELKPVVAIGGERTRICSHPVPLAARSRLHSARALAVGDSAGLVSPFSGEGVNYALRSARLAAAAVAAAVRNDDPGELAGYQKAVQNEIVPTMRACDAICPWLHWLIGVVDINRLAALIAADAAMIETMVAMAEDKEDWRALLARVIPRFPRLFFSSLG
jgi:flavin-dependent dehydrogenase